MNLKLLVASFLTKSNLEGFLYRIVQIAIILILARIALAILNKLVSQIFKVRRFHQMDERRINTLEALLKSINRYLVYFIAIVTVLQLFNVPVGSVLTTAGIAGVAVAFGAQSLVRDVITGFFLLMEDQFQVGDRVGIADVTGKVEEIGLRVTKIRDFGGQLHIIPNGKIEKVANFNTGPMLALVDIPIAYENNLEEVVGAVRECLDGFNRRHPELVEPAYYLGIQRLSEAGIVLRVLARTRPEGQWGVERELRQLIIECFTQRGVKLPVAPYRTESG